MGGPPIRVGCEATRSCSLVARICGEKLTISNNSNCRVRVGEIIACSTHLIEVGHPTQQDSAIINSTSRFFSFRAGARDFGRVLQRRCAARMGAVARAVEFRRCAVRRSAGRMKPTKYPLEEPRFRAKDIPRRSLGRPRFLTTAVAFRRRCRRPSAFAPARTTTCRPSTGRNTACWPSTGATEKCLVENGADRCAA